MTDIPLDHYLILSAIIFMIGVAGVLVRKNVIVMFMSIELMLNAVNLTLVVFSSFMGNAAGQIFVFFVMAVAAAEAAVGLSIIIALYRNKSTVNVSKINLMKW